MKQIVKPKVSLPICLRQLLQVVKSIHLHTDFTDFTSKTKFTYNHNLGDDVNKYYSVFTVMRVAQSFLTCNLHVVTCA